MARGITTSCTCRSASWRNAGLLDPAGVNRVFELHESESTTAATQTQLDAIINHMLGVQILHRKFVGTDVPAQARARAAELGWT